MAAEEKEQATTPLLDRERPEVIEEGTSLQVLLQDDHFLAQLERSVANYKRFVTICYRMTREKHWVNHGKASDPKYTLQGPGAEAMMTPLAISFDRPEFTRVDLGTGQYAYWAQGYVESKTLRRRGFYIGYCDSLDKFFNARPGWSPMTGEGDVKKAAYTNWTVNAVSRLAGIRDPDPALLEAAGLKPALIPGIDYEGGKTPEEAAGVISEPQGKRLFAIAKNKGVQIDVIKTYLGARFHIGHTKEIKRKDYNGIIEWIEKGGKLADDDEAKYQAWAKTLQGAQEAQPHQASGNGGDKGNGKDAPPAAAEPGDQAQ